MPFVNAYVTDTSNGELLKKVNSIAFTFGDCKGTEATSSVSLPYNPSNFYQIRVPKIPDCNLFDVKIYSPINGKREYVTLKMKDGVKNSRGDITFNNINFKGINFFPAEASVILEQNIQKSSTGTNTTGNNTTTTTTTNEPSANKSAVDISGKKPSKKKWIYIGLGILLVGGLVYYFKKRK